MDFVQLQMFIFVFKSEMKLAKAKAPEKPIPPYMRFSRKVKHLVSLLKSAKCQVSVS